MLLQSFAPQMLLELLAQSRDPKTVSDSPFFLAEQIQPRKHKRMPLAITNIEPYIANGDADGDGAGGQAARQAGVQVCKRAGRETGKQAGRQAGRQASKYVRM